MEFEWSTNDIAKKTVTIYSTNITLNKAACRHFEDVDYVLLGIDRKKNVLGIKPIGKSYARISNKSFISAIAEEYGFDLENNKCVKFKAKFDVIHQILLVDL